MQAISTWKSAAGFNLLACRAWRLESRREAMQSLGCMTALCSWLQWTLHLLASSATSQDNFCKSPDQQSWRSPNHRVADLLHKVRNITPRRQTGGQHKDLFINIQIISVRANAPLRSFNQQANESHSKCIWSFKNIKKNLGSNQGVEEKVKQETRERWPAPKPTDLEDTQFVMEDNYWETKRTLTPPLAEAQQAGGGTPPMILTNHGMNREPNEPESWTPPTRRWTYLKPRIDSESFTHDGKQMRILGQKWQKLFETTEDRMGNTLRREANGKDKRKITWWETNKGNRKQMKEYLHRARHLRWSSARHSESGREMKGEGRAPPLT